MRWEAPAPAQAEGLAESPASSATPDPEVTTQARRLCKVPVTGFVDGCTSDQAARLPEAEAARLAALGAAAGADASEVRLLLSYVSAAEVEAFYGLVARLVREYGAGAELSVAEARDLCRTPSHARARGEAIEEFLRFVVSTVGRYKESALATPREVKALSMYKQADEITTFYNLVEHLSAEHSVPPGRVKLLICTLGREAGEERLRMGSGAYSDFSTAAKVPDTAGRRDALRILGLDASAGCAAQPTSADITRRYRQLAKVWHPDKLASGCDEAAAARFREIKEAADLLLAR